MTLAPIWRIDVHDHDWAVAIIDGLGAGYLSPEGANFAEIAAGGETAGLIYETLAGDDGTIITDPDTGQSSLSTATNGQFSAAALNTFGNLTYESTITATVTSP